MNALALDKIHHVRTAFLYLVDALNSHSRAFDHVGRARSRHQLETHIHKVTRYVGDVALVVVRYA